MISFEALLETRPLIHGHGTRSLGIAASLARFLDQHAEPTHVTLETGAGLSTLVIARKGIRRHIAIAPAQDEFDRIRAFLSQRQIDSRCLELVVSRSQDYLPHAEIPALDLVLIDGDHSFPAPFFDWYFTADRLTIGGLMIVDDIDIITGTILADFMRKDPKWEEVARDPSERFAIYRKLRHPIHTGNWQAQPYLADVYPTKAVKAFRRLPPGPVERGLARVLPWRLVQARLRRHFDWPRPE